MNQIHLRLKMRFYQHKHFIHLFSLETYHKLVVTEIRVFHFQDLLFGNTTVLQLTTVGSEKGNRITAGWGGQLVVIVWKLAIPLVIHKT